MGKVRVIYGGLVRNVVGRSDEEIEIGKEVTMQDLLVMLIDRHGDDLKVSLFSSDGKVRPAARILLNEDNIGVLEGFAATIPMASEVTLEVMAYPMEGG